MEDSWGDAGAVQDLGQLQSVLGWMQFSFQEWENSVFGSVKKDLARLRRELRGCAAMISIRWPFLAIETNYDQNFRAAGQGGNHGEAALMNFLAQGR